MQGKPCTTEIIHPWINISMPRTANTLEPSTISSNIIDNPEDSILLVADSRQRCQNFVVYIDDVRVGVTSGEGALDGTWCGTGEECIEKHGGSHAYFKLLKGKRYLYLTHQHVSHANLLSFIFQDDARLAFNGSMCRKHAKNIPKQLDLSRCISLVTQWCRIAYLEGF